MRYGQAQSQTQETKKTESNQLTSILLKSVNFDQPLETVLTQICEIFGHKLCVLVINLLLKFDAKMGLKSVSKDLISVLKKINPQKDAVPTCLLNQLSKMKGKAPSASLRKSQHVQDYRSKFKQMT